MTGAIITQNSGDRFHRRFLALLLGGLLLALFQSANAGTSPREIVRQASEEVLDTLQRDEQIRADSQRLYSLVDQVLVERMDFERMSRWVLGKYWRRASPAQRQQFANEFRRLLVRTYATALAGYSGQQVRFLPMREDADAERVTVRTEIEQPAGPSVPVHYSLHNRDGTWKAYDVTIDGISMVANYRSTFSAEIRKGGVDHLLQTLAARNGKAKNEF